MKHLKMLKLSRIQIKIVIAVAVVTLCGAGYWLNNPMIEIPYEYSIKKIVQSKTPENFCYNYVGNELPYVNDRFSPGHRSIYFHETSCSGGINSRQACAVEAAAKWNSAYTIYVLFLSPIRKLGQKSLITLKRYKNVKFYRVNLDQYAKGTPLENLLKSGALNKTVFKVSHTSDFLRYLTLYKWGGVYLDLDTIVVKPLGGLKLNWAARESDHAVASGALSMARDTLGRFLAAATVSELAKHWSGEDWGANGPRVITEVLKEMCAKELVNYTKASRCQGIEIYPEKYFNPIRWQQAEQYFHTPTKNYSEAFVHHVWNRFSSKLAVRNDSLYAVLAKKNCPKIYKVYGNDFGL